MDLESELRRLIGDEPKAAVIDESIEWSPVPFGRPAEPQPPDDEPL